MHQRCTEPTHRPSIVIPAKPGTQRPHPPPRIPRPAPPDESRDPGAASPTVQDQPQTRRVHLQMHRGMRRRCGASLMHPTRPELGDRAGQFRRTNSAHPKQTQRVSAKVWGIERPRIYGAPCRGILPRMTRHKHAQTGLVTPSPLDPWIDAMLRAFAMLVLHVASTLQMIRRREAVIGTQPMPTDLPRAKTDTQSKETIPAAQHRSHPNSAHAEQRSCAARPSKHGRVLTDLEADIHVRVPREGGDPVLSRKTRARRPEFLRDLSGPPPARGMRLLKQPAPNKNAPT